jgi:7-cyano-7-deazaguanine reductase
VLQAVFDGSLPGKGSIQSSARIVLHNDFALNLERSAVYFSRMSDSLTLLGNSQTIWPQSPDQAKLETFPNRSPQHAYWVHLDFPEFSSLCPVTGQPDTARIQIRYIPDQVCVETKSLKFYLTSFRNTKSFNEEIVNRILAELVAVLHPKQLVVRGDFSPRGGISLTAQASHPAATWEGLSIDQS